MDLGVSRTELVPGLDITKTAPGRVNLIGEHTDYSNLPVLPMAIDRTVSVRATADQKGPLKINSEAFPNPLELNAGTELGRLTGWHRYAFAAAAVTGTLKVPATLVISSNLPSQGGLSSSSALTVALVGVFVELLGEVVTIDELVGLAVKAERLTGVAGGTMDQNIIVRAKAGTAMRLGFSPFTSDYVTLPSDIAVVAAHSGVTAAKGQEAKAGYNSRVSRCRTAAAELAGILGLPANPSLVLGDVSSVPGCIEAVAELTPESRKCAEHVLSEAVRVDQAVTAIRASDGPELGRLLDESHASLVRFGVSVPRLDAVVASMKSAGAYGARLTGAGFGGYAISVCSPNKVDAIVARAIETGGGPAMRVWPSGGSS